MTTRPAFFSFLLGGIATVGLAPLGLWPVTLGCLAAWMWLVHRAPGLKGALWRGWLFGFAHFAIGNNWIAKAFTYQDAVPHWLGPVAPALLAAYLGVYPMLAAAVAWRLRRATPDLGPDLGYVLTFAAAWIATEYLRGTMLTGYPWNPLSEVWLPLIGVARSMRWIGTYALSGLTVLAAGAVMLLAFRRFAPFALTALAVFLLALDGVDIARTRVAPASDAPRIRVVQPDLDQEQRPRDDYPETNLRALARLSGRPGPAPRLIVWPEGALRYLIEDGYPAGYYFPAAPVTRARIAGLLGPRDVVLTGGEALDFDAAGTITSATNSVFALDPHARILGRYDKAHLVPWGEYLPARPLMSAIGLSRLVAGDYDFAPGHGPDGLDLPAFGRVGFAICYEIIFSGSVVQPGRRPAFLFQPSNDSWYGTWGQAEHLAQARMRAIEEGLPVIRATPTGISAIIDAQGRVLATIPAETAGAIELPLPPAAAPTLFARAGNLMALLVGALLALSAIAFRLRWR